MKVCKDCNKMLPLSEFYVHKMMADGHLNKCKACVKARVAKHREENIESVRAYDRERGRTPGRISASVEQNRRWRKEDSRRVAAHNAVARALRAGTITKKDCERCASPQSLAHHESYDRKLDVTWLCQPCHKERHKELVLAGIEP